jgi:hypothetical protein
VLEDELSASEIRDLRLAAVAVAAVVVAAVLPATWN